MMYKRVPLVVLLMAPLLLSGCSNTVSGTPFFNAGEGITATPTAQATNGTVEDSSESTKGTVNEKETKPSETKLAESQKGKSSKGIKENTKEFAEKYDLKINEQGIPYSDRGNVPITEGPEFEAVKKANEARTEESVKNDFVASQSLVNELAGIYNSYYTALMDKDWKKACSYINLSDSSEKECIASLKENEGQYRTDLKGMNGDTVKAMVYDSDNIILTLGLEREKNESAKFFKTDKGWKITVKL